MFARNAAGKLSSTTDGHGDVTAFTYGSGFKLLTMTTASGSVTTTPGVWTVAYGAASGTPPTRTTTFTDPNRNATVYTIDDGTADVTQVRDARTFLHTTGYNAHNDTTSMANDYNDTTNIGIATSTYNLTSITAPTTGTGGTGDPGRTQTYQYTTAPANTTGTKATTDYRPMSSTDSQANVTNMAYNQ